MHGLEQTEFNDVLRPGVFGLIGFSGVIEEVMTGKDLLAALRGDGIIQR